jgi:hypothetical protein
MLANGSLVYPAKVEGNVLKAARYWGRDCSVVNGSLEEPGRTSLHLGLPSTWGSVDGDQIFFLFFRGMVPYWGL